MNKLDSLTEDDLTAEARLAAILRLCKTDWYLMRADTESDSTIRVVQVHKLLAIIMPETAEKTVSRSKQQEKPNE